MTSDQSSPLQFPCRFPIKAMGRAAPDFEARVVESVRRHLPAGGAVEAASRLSQGGNYLAVTVIITATSREQLDAIYRDLTACPEVTMAL